MEWLSYLNAAPRLHFRRKGDRETGNAMDCKNYLAKTPGSGILPGIAPEKIGHQPASLA
jgi:hypothetical protein